MRKKISNIAKLPSGFTDELKLVYQKFFKKGFIYSIVIHIFIIAVYGVYSYFQYLSAEEERKSNQRVINVTFTDLAPPPSVVEEEELLPPVEPEEIIEPKKDLEAMTPEPVAKEKAEVQTIKTQKELEEIKTPVTNTGDTGTFVYSGDVKVDEKKLEKKIEKSENVEKFVKEKTIYQQFEVEKPPECVNLTQVRASMNYPDFAIEASIEGRITAKVLVGTSGNVIKVGSLSGPSVFYDEVRDKAKNLEFTPGLQNGKPVKVWVSVPFIFRLTN